MSEARGGLQLDPAPPWAEPLLGSPARRVLVGGRPDRLVYDLLGVGRALRVVIPVTRDGGGLDWSRAALEPVRGPPPTRRIWESLRDDPESLLRRGAARDAWLVRELGGVALPAGYAPSPTEVALAGLAGPLADADAPFPGGPTLADPFFRAVGLYAAAVHRDWASVFGRSDGSESEAPWFAPILAVLDGDVYRTQELAARAADGRIPASPAACITGLVLKEHGHVEAAIALLSASLGHLGPRQRAGVLLQLGRALARTDRVDAAREVLRGTVLAADHDPETQRRAAAEMARLGFLDDAYLVLQDLTAQWPDNLRAGLDFVNLLLWAGELDRASRILDLLQEHAPQETAFLRYRGAIAVERDEIEVALGHLERLATRDPDDREGRTWLCEALIRHGDAEDAERHLAEARSQHDSAAHILLAGALHSVHARAEDGELAALFRELGEPLNADATDADLREQCLRVLRSLRGSRGEILVRRDPVSVGPTGVSMLRLQRQETRRSSRIESGEAVKSVVFRPLQRVFETFDDILARYPESAHPLCYRGEVKLWLGDYDGAMADFDAALERHTARWGFVGRAATHLLQGRVEPALEQIALCDRYFTPIPSATTHIYLGETWRRQGRYDLALSHLRESLRVKSGRISGWMNLALTLDATGEHDETRAIFARLVAWAPRLLWDARRAVSGRGDEPLPWPPRPEDMGILLESALGLMRGNRSSHCITYFDPDGVFRQVHDADHRATTLDRWRVFLWTEVRQRLAPAP